MRAQAILFDLDDTLFDHSSIQRRLTVELRQRHPAFARIDAEVLAVRSTQHHEELHPRVVAGELSLSEVRIERHRRLLGEFGAADDEAVALARWHALAKVEAETLVPDTRERVEAARTLGLRMAIASNNTRAEQPHKLDRHGLVPHFDAHSTEPTGFPRGHAARHPWPAYAPSPAARHQPRSPWHAAARPVSLRKLPPPRRRTAAAGAA